MAEEIKNDPVVDVEQAFTKTEQYIENNQKPLLIAVGVIISVVAIYFGYKKLYYEDLVKEAASKIYFAEQAFEKDSFNLALNGTQAGQMGFIQVIDEYGSTPAGNLANYYAGICYLKKGEYENAIKYLEGFDQKDQVVSNVALAAIGDAHMELGHADEAITYYIKAAEHNTNKFTSPIFLKKAGLAYEEKGQFADAVKVYEKIKNEYSASQEGKEIEKYIARAKGMAGM